MLLRPLRGRRRIDQLIIVGVPTLVLALSGAVALLWHELQVERTTSRHVQATARMEVPARIAWNVTLEELAGTFQGTINTGDSSAWLMLQIDQPRMEEETVFFHYTINSSTRRHSGNGAASLVGRWIELGSLKGQIVRNNRGALTFRSMPRNTKPDWILEASR